MLLKYIYTVFLGILLATFVGVGIAAFYPAPQAPEYPTELSKPSVAPNGISTETPEQVKMREDYDKKQKAHFETMKTYSRNVSLAALSAAIIILVISLALVHQLREISDGILFGGVLTLLYSIGWGFASTDNKYRFLLVTVGLVIGFVLGYIKFLKPEKAK